MREAIVTVGPQGAGKSTFCEKIVALYPKIKLVSRDAILLELFGSVYLNPYTGGHQLAFEKMWELVAEHLQQEDLVLILDCWNDDARGRRDITRKLRYLGAETVNAWYFITPEETCIDWVMAKLAAIAKKEKITFDSERESYVDYYRGYHRQPVRLIQGFDAIIKVNPLEMPSVGELFKTPVSR